VEITDAEILYRRVTDLHVDQAGRATSFAFKPRQQDGDGVSLFAGSLKSVDEVLEGHDGFGVVAITAGDARRCGAILDRDPAEPAHVLIRTPLSKSVIRALADKARTIRTPGSRQ
jgi:hypothetical protein